MLDEYVECENCDFVLRAESVDDPTPKEWDACPDCGGANFRVIDR